MNEPNTPIYRCPLCHSSLSERREDVVGSRQRFICLNGHQYCGHYGVVDFLPAELIENSPEKRMESESHDVNVLDVHANAEVTETDFYSWLNYYQLFDGI